MTTKYYAVVSGRIPGIYTNWIQANSMVEGYPNAIFKSFRKKEDAENFMKNSNTRIKNKNISTPNVLPQTDKTTIYIDGNYDGNLAGFGVIILLSNGDKITANGKVPLQYVTKHISELYAIYVALSLVGTGDIVVYSDSEYCINCFNVYINDPDKNICIANVNLIRPILELMKNRNVIIQHIRNHKGKELNDEVNNLAKRGRFEHESLIIMKNGNRFIPEN